MIMTDVERERARQLEERNARLEAAFSGTLKTPDGRLVLAWLLARCRLGCELDNNPGHIALHNLGIALLNKCARADEQAAINLLWDEFWKH